MKPWKAMDKHEQRIAMTDLAIDDMNACLDHLLSLSPRQMVIHLDEMADLLDRMVELEEIANESMKLAT